jgi:hypothetical protein
MTRNTKINFVEILAGGKPLLSEEFTTGLRLPAMSKPELTRRQLLRLSTAAAVGA